MGEIQGSIPAYIDSIVNFSAEESYELLQPLATFRHCHDGTPAEARMVFTCRRVENASSDEFVMKIKVQYRPAPAQKAQLAKLIQISRVPGGPQKPSPELETGPSTTTAAELKALETFRKENIPFTPILVNYKQSIQGLNGLFPGGYLTFTVMTKMPGDSLYNLNFWGMPTEEREEIVQKFLDALR